MASADEVWRVTALEQKFSRYKEPSSPTEQDKQERAGRMVRGALQSWPGFKDITYTVLPKGSYANNTNVKTDSDVDVAVIHEGFHYFDDDELPSGRKIARESLDSFHYTPTEFRAEIAEALRETFGDQCDSTGHTAINICETSTRVSVDIVPSFRYRHYYYHPFWGNLHYDGTKTLRTDGKWLVNYPEQQLANGRKKNNDTNKRYKQQVRILKRTENDLVEAGRIEALPSYFMECLVYNVPNSKFGSLFSATPLTDVFRRVLSYVYEATGPRGAATSWAEPNGIKPLFGADQPWSIEDARNLARVAWNHYDFG